MAGRYSGPLFYLRTRTSLGRPTVTIVTPGGVVFRPIKKTGFKIFEVHYFTYLCLPKKNSQSA